MRRAALLTATVAALLAIGTPAAGAAPSWLPAQALPESGTDATAPQVAMDPAGDLVVAWNSDSAAGQVVKAASRPAGGSWGNPVTLSSPTVHADLADIVIAPSGESTVMWSTPIGEHLVQVATMSPAGNWSEPVAIAGPSLVANGSQLAVDSAGDVTAADEIWNGTHIVVEVASRAPGGAWSTPTTVSSGAENGQGAAVAVDDHGDAVVVWHQGPTLIEAARRLKGGAWSAPVKLSESGVTVTEPAVAMDAAGEAVVVWDRSAGGGNYDVQSASMDPGGTWRGAVNLTEGTDTNQPEVGIDAGGEAVAVWEHAESFPSVRIEGASRPAGSAWAQPKILTPAGQIATNATLTMSSAGLAVLTWQGGPTIEALSPFGAVRPAGGGWSAPQGLAPNAKKGNYPIPATDAGGDAVAAWESYGDGSSDVVEVAGFDGAGPRLTSVSIPGSGLAGQPLAFAVKATDVWSSFAASWLFGDNGIAQGDAVTHTYLSGGNYPVSLTVTDAVGNSTTASGAVAVVAASHGYAWAHGNALVRRGRAALGLRCGGGECAGVAKLYLPPPRGVKGHHRRPILAGKAAFRIASSAHRIVEVKLRRSALARLRSSRRRRLVTNLRGTDITPGKVVLREAKRKSKHRHR